VVGELEQFKNKKTPLHLIVKDEKGKDTGELNVEIEWNAKEEKKIVETPPPPLPPPSLIPAAVVEIPKKEEEKEVRARALEDTTTIKPEKATEEEKDALNVRIINAKFYEKQDVFGAGDPYVQVKFNNKKFRTKTYNNTKTATYNEGMYDNIYAHIHIHIYS
jgi:hypothetical protein